jgi:hypothetical protein
MQQLYAVNYSTPWRSILLQRPGWIELGGTFVTELDGEKSEVNINKDATSSIQDTNRRPETQCHNACGRSAACSVVAPAPAGREFLPRTRLWWTATDARPEGALPPLYRS